MLILESKGGENRDIHHVFSTHTGYQFLHNLFVSVPLIRVVGTKVTEEKLHVININSYEDV